mmetsp:Transcript_26939/g.26001  ORF Transcript_26939/g.26001 Transcript_26939/m.26001 type:complete len:158 (+) Transcript_26939:405-878(+)|eukprot:CAMPEP_0170543754 /NCGR_PEP_ID=MMETSP0211-20121228/2765_1 /TAXON_ID=311385 /ORGANISM="Pseudokeronopsis sp., Strain OXSARD2" /LENGTH=157 /DNA_ID=CAMNT_0010847215 /DNA_START=343 /DNA_END=816 /DNA_ORIENTATION=-
MAYWHITNQVSKVYMNDYKQFLECLLMCAFYSKKLLMTEEAVRAYDAYFIKFFPDFMKDYINWENFIEKEMDMANYSINNLSLVFESLFSEIDYSGELNIDQIPDYNFIVDNLEDEHMKRSIDTPRFLDKIYKEDKLPGKEPYGKDIKFETKTVQRP